jgi:hypothetical protein
MTKVEEIFYKVANASMMTWQLDFNCKSEEEKKAIDELNKALNDACSALRKLRALEEK